MVAVAKRDGKGNSGSYAAVKPRKPAKEGKPVPTSTRQFARGAQERRARAMADLTNSSNNSNNSSNARGWEGEEDGAEGDNSALTLKPQQQREQNGYSRHASAMHLETSASAPHKPRLGKPLQQTPLSC